MYGQQCIHLQARPVEAAHRAKKPKLTAPEPAKPAAWQVLGQHLFCGRRHSYCVGNVLTQAAADYSGRKPKLERRHCSASWLAS